MRRAEKAARIVRVLDSLYPETPIPLEHRDPFTLLIAVLLSAQTTDKKVNEVTPALFERAPTPEAMAEVPVSEIQGYIRQLGLAPQKAKNIKALSQMLVEAAASRGAGARSTDVRRAEVPRSFDELEALPGVGHKTASVVMAQAFGEPAFPVDTHIHRLAARWGLSDGSNVTKTERDLKRLFAPELWNKLHLQIIYFGREHCPARFHDLESCPICSFAATKKRAREEQRANDALRQRRRSSPKTSAFRRRSP